MAVHFQFYERSTYIDDQQWNQYVTNYQEVAQQVFSADVAAHQAGAMLGWMDFGMYASEQRLVEIEAFGVNIRANYDVLVISGVGGSIQATLAVLMGLGMNQIPTYYIGNTMSARAVQSVLAQLQGKRVYFIDIAKNFETLEPGIGFRLMTDYLRRTTAHYAAHVSVVGTPGSALHKLAQEEGFCFWPFDEEIGGRFSGFSDVSLLPLAVNGVNIAAFIDGAKALQVRYRELDAKDNPSYQYALSRYALYQAGKAIEIFASFEPHLEHVLKWCVQLFAESEGKDRKGLFPARANYSEDLHAIGQYVQDGQRNLIETFFHVHEEIEHVLIPNNGLNDGFGYIEGKSLKEINDTVFHATLTAHHDATVPCFVVTLDTLDERHLGELFYFFMTACYISALLLEVNPFNQDGVEAYKTNMFTSLGK